jgi:DNA uptake protein ComE-like DNA-binding protein
MNRLLTAATLVALVACQKANDAARDSAAGVLADTNPPTASRLPDSTAAATAQPTEGVQPQAGALLDPNTATKQQLTAIQGITPALADSIIAKRPYENMTGVNKVLAGLTKQQRDTVYQKLFKPLDLNTATDEEILSIPGIGNRMLREFKEYRPYKNIDQFRREIGKYVSKDEVARLERYVTIK